MWSGVLALLLAYFVAGAISPLFVKLGTHNISAFTFTFFRFLIASLIILPFFLKQKNRFKKKDIKNIAFNSIFFFLNVSLFSIGIQFTTTLASQLLYAMVPLVVAFLAHALLNEKITKQKVIGGTVAFIGLIIIIFQALSSGGGLSIGQPVGIVILLLAVLCWSLYIVFSKRIGSSYSSVTISSINFFATLLFLIPFVLYELNSSGFVLQINTTSMVSLFGVAVFSSVLMTVLIQFGIRKTSAFIASLFTYLSPFFTSITGIPILHEQITLHVVVGGTLILLGVFYATSYDYIRKKLK